MVTIGAVATVVTGAVVVLDDEVVVDGRSVVEIVDEGVVELDREGSELDDEVSKFDGDAESADTSPLEHPAATAASTTIVATAVIVRLMVGSVPLRSASMLS